MGDMNGSSELDAAATPECPPPGGMVGSVALGVVMSACCLLTIVGNAMVLHAVRTERKLQTVSDINR